MRLKNVKGADKKIEECSLVIKNPEVYRGKYKEIFDNNNPIHLEIGMGKGNFIINMAKTFKDINFIGVEMYDSVMVRAVEKLEDNISNLRFIKIDAVNIEEIFNKEIDVLYLNFSDPWPKSRHEDRRLTSLRFLKRYDNIFRKEKTIIQKTDNRHFFEYSLKSLTDYNYKILEISLDLHKDDVFNVETEYEKKFSDKGYPIYMAKVIK